MVVEGNDRNVVLVVVEGNNRNGVVVVVVEGNDRNVVVVVVVCCWVAIEMWYCRARAG